MEPENDAFQKDSSFPGAEFQVNHLKLPGCIYFWGDYMMILAGTPLRFF